MPSAAAGPSHKEIFDAYVWLWVASHVLQYQHDSYMIPHRYWLYIQILFFAAAMFRPSRFNVSAAFLVRTAMYLARAPLLWESNIWAVIVDLIFAGACTLKPLDQVVRTCSDQIRIHMGLFYIGAGFWKINSSFLSPRVSCGSIYVASILYFLPEFLTPHWLVGPALATGGPITVVGEMALGVGIMSSSRTLRHMGIISAAVLHYMIAIAPYPNQVPEFGVFCITRMFMVMPEAWTGDTTQTRWTSHVAVDM